MIDRTAIAFPLVVASLMAFMVTGIATAINDGISASYPGLWLRQFLFIWPIACSVVFIALALARRITPWLMRGIDYLFPQI